MLLSYQINKLLIKSIFFEDCCFILKNFFEVRTINKYSKILYLYIIIKKLRWLNIYIYITKKNHTLVKIEFIPPSKSKIKLKIRQHILNCCCLKSQTHSIFLVLKVKKLSLQWWSQPIVISLQITMILLTIIIRYWNKSISTKS